MKNGHTTRQKTPAGRYALLDELRGLDLVSMMLYHACWDMMFLFGIWMDWFYSADYFGLLPWLFLFWAGYYLHKAVGHRRMEPLRRSVCPALGWMGRHSLLLYLLHQPVIYGVLSAAAVLFA